MRTSKSPMSRINLVVVAALIVASVSAERLYAELQAIDELGRVTQWFLAFANDPYDAPGVGDEGLKPEPTALAILDTVKFPADESDQEKVLVARFSKQKLSDIPKSLEKFIKADFDIWKKGSAARKKLKLKFDRGLSGGDPAAVRREGKTVILPIAAVGRAVLRATRDDEGLFKNFMWVLSHPTYSSSHPSRYSDSFVLTKACAGPTIEGTEKRCGGRTFYHSRQPDIVSAVGKFEASLRRQLRSVFESEF